MSKKLVIAIVVPVVLLGAVAGGAYVYRDKREAASRQAATEFLNSLGGLGDDALQRAFVLTDAAHRNADSVRARQEFPEKLLRLGLLDGVQDSSCGGIRRESNIINSFTTALHGVECQWREGRGVLYVLASDGRPLVISADIDQHGHEML